MRCWKRGEGRAPERDGTCRCWRACWRDSSSTEAWLSLSVGARHRPFNAARVEYMPWLGHQSLSTTSIYLHTTEDDRREAVGMLSRALGG